MVKNYLSAFDDAFLEICIIERYEIVCYVQIVLDGWKKLCLNTNMDPKEDSNPTKKVEEKI